MSNNINYIQEIEKVQNKEKKYYSYIYEIKHIPTGKLYVGSRCAQSVLKKFEDCYTDKYMGSSNRKEGPFSKVDIKINPQNYQKTILKVFYSEDINIAWKSEHGENGLISTYFKMYGKDICLNGYYHKTNGDKVWSTAGQNYYVNKSKEEITEINLKRSKSLKGKNKGKNTFANKSELEMLEINIRKSKAIKLSWQNKTEEEREEHKIKNRNAQLIAQKNPSTKKKKSDSQKEALTKRTTEQIQNSVTKYKKTKAQNIANGKIYKKPILYFYKCPYDYSIIRDPRNMAQYIQKNYPDKKQWIEYTKEEKENLKIQNGDKNEKAN